MTTTTNILVTGGAGFIGSNLIEYLLKRDDDNCYNDDYQRKKLNIVSLDNYLSGKKENHLLDERVQYIQGNTWDAETIFNDEQTFDIIFHFGEYSRIVYSFEEIKILHQSILRGTPVILELARKWNAKVIYSASSSMMGNNGEDQHLSPYAWMKSKMIELIKNYHQWYGLSYQICYFFNVYGERHISEGKYATVIAIFERQYKNKEALTIVSPGTQTRDFTHVKDIVSALFEIKDTIHHNHEWYLRYGKSVSIYELANYFQHKIKMIPERNGERFNCCDKDNDTQQLLDWKPKYDIEDYIKTFLDSYQDK